MINKRIVALAIVLTILGSGFVLAKDAPSSGTFSVLYDAEGQVTEAPPITLPAYVQGNGISGLSLSRGPGIKPAGLKNGFSSDNWIVTDLTVEGAIAAGTYLEFGLSVDTGFTASLETLDFSLRRSALNGPMNYELQVSLDNFESPGITVKSFTYYGRVSGTAPDPCPLDNDPYYYMHSDLAGRGNTATSPGDPIPTVDLTAFPELQDIPGGTNVIFRLYAWGNEKTTPTNTVSFGRMQGPVITGLSKPTSD